MKQLHILSLLLLCCLGMIPLSCSKPDDAEGIEGNEGETPSESQYVGTWAILNDDGRAVGIDVIGKDMTLRMYNATEDNGYGFDDGVVSASLEDFESDNYVYDISNDGTLSLGGVDVGIITLESEDVLSITSDRSVSTAYRVTEFVGKPAPSIIGTWDVVRYYLKNGDGAIEEDSEGEGEYFVFSETEMSLYFSPDEAPEVYQYILEDGIISFNDLDGYPMMYKIQELTETDMTLFVDYTEDGDTSGWYYELRKR